MPSLSEDAFIGILDAMGGWIGTEVGVIIRPARVSLSEPSSRDVVLYASGVLSHGEDMRRDPVVPSTVEAWRFVLRGEAGIELNLYRASIDEWKSSENGLVVRTRQLHIEVMPLGT